MSRMFRRSLPSHGGIVTFGQVPMPLASGVGARAVGLGRVARRRSGSLARRATPDGAWLALAGARASSSSMKTQLSTSVEGEQVVARDDDVAAGHDEDDREQAGDRQRVERRARGRPSRPPPERVDRVQEVGDPVGVDDRDEPVDERRRG